MDDFQTHLAECRLRPWHQQSALKAEASRCLIQLCCTLDCVESFQFPCMSSVKFKGLLVRSKFNCMIHIHFPFENFTYSYLRMQAGILWLGDLLLLPLPGTQSRGKFCQGNGFYRNISPVFMSFTWIN